MRRRSTRARMGLRGRSGVLAYMLFATAILVALYYVWNNFFFTASSKITYSSVQGLKPDHMAQWDRQKQQGFAIEEPPIGLNREIEIQMENEKWKKEKALQDRIDEERLLEEQSARQNAKSGNNNNGQGTQDQQRDGGNGAKQKEGVGPKPLLFEPADPLDGDYFAKLERLVHLDLKGAPPLVSYLEQLFPVLKKLGATGLLIEYEDMFPFTGNISILASAAAYSQSDLLRIRAAAKSNGLEIIPLVQTFGHMEFVLKYQQYSSLREHDYTPQVITPVKEESYDLLFDILEQVMVAHPDSRRIHLGCDEVYQLGKGQSNSFITSQRITPSHLFLRHVSKVASHIKKTYPRIQPLIWDDWLRKIPFDVLADSNLSAFVEPVVWYYQHNILERVPREVWDMYGKLFPAVWVASAFKGATGSAQIITNASFHLDNNLQFVNIMRLFGAQMRRVNFRGTVLTGWQRYDHFATLCELLPVGLPSLALSLQALRSGGFGPQEVLTASQLLNCSAKLDLEFPALDTNGAHVSQDCRFPGSSVYYGVQQLWGIMEMYKRDRGLQERIAGWMTDYQLRQGLSSPGQMRILAQKLSKMLDRLRDLVSPMRNNLLQIYNSSTVDEWVATNLEDPTTHIRELLDKAKTLLKRKDWPARPFPKPSAPAEAVIQPVVGQPQKGQSGSGLSRHADTMGQYVPRNSAPSVWPQGPQPSHLRSQGNLPGAISKVTVLPHSGRIAKEGGAQQAGGGAAQGGVGNVGRQGGGILAQALFTKPDLSRGRPSGPGKVQAYNPPPHNALNPNPQGVPGGQKQQQQVQNPAGLGRYVHVLPLNPQGVNRSQNQQGLGQNQQRLGQSQQAFGQSQGGFGQNQQGGGQGLQGLGRNQSGLGQAQQRLGVGQNQQGFGQNQLGLGQAQKGLEQNQQRFGQNQQGFGQYQGLGQNQQRFGQNQQVLSQKVQGLGQSHQNVQQNLQGFGQSVQGLPQNPQGLTPNSQRLPQSALGEGRNQQRPLAVQDHQKLGDLDPFVKDQKEEGIAGEEKNRPFHDVDNAEKESDKDKQLHSLSNKEVPVKDFRHQHADRDDKGHNSADFIPTIDENGNLPPGNDMNELEESDRAGDEGARYLDHFVGRKGFGGNGMNEFPVQIDEHHGKALNKAEQDEREETEYDAEDDV